MSLARTSPPLRARPSLRTRILENQRRMNNIPAGHSGLTKPTSQSFSELYRGTEFETHFQRLVVSEPLVSRGRMLWMVAGSATAVMIGVVLVAIPA